MTKLLRIDAILANSSLIKINLLQRPYYIGNISASRRERRNMAKRTLTINFASIKRGVYYICLLTLHALILVRRENKLHKKLNMLHLGWIYFGRN